MFRPFKNLSNGQALVWTGVCIGLAVVYEKMPAPPEKEPDARSSPWEQLRTPAPPVGGARRTAGGGGGGGAEGPGDARER